MQGKFRISSIHFICVVSIMLCFCFSAISQVYSFKNLSRQDGLTSDGIYHLAQGPNNELWIGTEEGGVCIFDGIELRKLESDSLLDKASVRYLMQDSDKRMWICTSDLGIFILDPKGNIERLNIENGLNSNHVRSVIEKSKNEFIIATLGGGISIWKEGGLTSYTSPELLHKNCRSLAMNIHKEVLIATDKGPMILKDDTFEKIEWPIRWNNKIICAFADSEGEFWLGTDEGIVKLNGSQTSRIVIPGLDRARVKDITKDHLDRYWIGTKDGAYCVVKEGDQYKIQKKIDHSNGLSHSRVRDVYVDHSGSLWYGTFFGGVSHLMDESIAEYSWEDGFPKTYISAVCRDIEDKIWLGTYEGDVYLSDGLVCERVWNSTSENQEHPITSIATEGNNVYVGTSNEGLLIHQLKDSKGEWSKMPSGFDQIVDVSTFGNSVSFISPFELGYQRGSHQSTFFTPNKTELTCVIQNEKGLYLGTKSGLYFYRKTKDGILMSSAFPELVTKTDLKSITDLSVDPSGIIWAITSDKKVFKVDEISAQKISLPKRINSTFTGIHVDSEYNLWIGTFNGLKCIELDPSQSFVLDYRLFDSKSGITGVVSKNGVSFNDDKLMIGTSQGLFSYSSSFEFHNPYPPEIWIDKIELFYEDVDWTELGQSNDERRVPKQLDLSYDQNHLTFIMDVVDLSSLGEVMLEYKLEGHDLTWSNPTSSIEHTYAQLPYGNFTLQVRAQNSDGIWSEKPMAYPIRIRPPIYFEPWFIAITVLGISLFIFGGVRWRLKTLQKRNRILEFKVDERTKLLAKEQKKSESLLLNILPEKTANELKENGFAKPKHYDSATVLFSDFKGFTTLTEKLNSDELVESLNDAFQIFDDICDEFKVEKIKTIGDAYMCATGIPSEDPDHALNMVNYAQGMLSAMSEINARNKSKGLPEWQIRIGIHTGPLIAGVVGKKKFAYDIWGDTVNIAARMESSGEENRINISASTYEIVKDQFKCDPRGKIKAKNKGELEMYFVQ